MKTNWVKNKLRGNNSTEEIDPMATEKQKLANKKNAQKSTGPKTPAGKAKVAKNPTKHGVFTSALVITVGDGKEDFTEYSALYEALMHDLNPAGKMQELLVEKIVVDHWRLRRLLRYEAGEILSRSHNFKNETINNHLSPTWGLLEPEKPAPQPLTFFKYDSVVTDDDLNDQISIVSTLENSQKELTAIEYVLEIVAGEYHLDSEIGKTEKEKAKNLIKSWSAEEQKSFRQDIVITERKYLREMQEVREWKDTFDRLARIRCIPTEDDLNKITKYETALESSIFKNLSVLMTLQKNRKKLSIEKMKDNE